MEIIGKCKKTRTIKVRFDSERPKPSRFVKIVSEEELPAEEVLRKGGVKENVIPKRITYIEYSKIGYEELTEKMIREKYSVSDELALLRQKEIKSDEYALYYAFVEGCKSKAKAFVAEREGEEENE